LRHPRRYISMNTAISDLPNLNFGLNVKNLHAQLGPNVIPCILDHYQRRPEKEELVVGTVLGSIDGPQINVTNCFAVPLSFEQGEGGEDEGRLDVDMEYQRKMLKFFRKVNPKEGLLGMYVSTYEFNDQTISAIQFYHDLFKTEEKKRALLPFPLIMMVDPLLKNNEMQIKIYNLVSLFMAKMPVFCEIQHSFATQNISESGLDILFFGQEHYDTQALLTKNQSVEQSMITELSKNQRLFSNKEYLQKNLKDMIASVKVLEEYAESVAAGKREGDPQIAKELNDLMSIFSECDLGILEEMVKSNYEETIVAGSLAKLQRAQIVMAEKLNNVFAARSSSD